MPQWRPHTPYSWQARRSAAHLPPDHGELVVGVRDSLPRHAHDRQLEPHRCSGPTRGDASKRRQSGADGRPRWAPLRSHDDQLLRIPGSSLTTHDEGTGRRHDQGDRRRLARPDTERGFLLDGFSPAILRRRRRWTASSPTRSRGWMLRSTWRLTRPTWSGGSLGDGCVVATASTSSTSTTALLKWQESATPAVASCTSATTTARRLFVGD